MSYETNMEFLNHTSILEVPIFTMTTNIAFPSCGCGCLELAGTFDYTLLFKSLYNLSYVRGDYFTMGDTLDGESDAIPTTTTVTTFFMDQTTITLAHWQEIFSWATNHGYGFDNAGSGKGTNHPVQSVNWYDVVKWNNARSKSHELNPCYYTDAALTQVYTNGDLDAIYVNWKANGYRLPTEAEWELAARNGLIENRFTWGNTINESQANYCAQPGSNSYDLGPYSGYNTNYSHGDRPYTRPPDSTLHLSQLDSMEGNVSVWCWDWYAPGYAGGTNPHGPATGSARTVRGGGWDSTAYSCRTAYRGKFPANTVRNDIGFRSITLM